MDNYASTAPLGMNKVSDNRVLTLILIVSRFRRKCVGIGCETELYVLDLR